MYCIKNHSLMDPFSEYKGYLFSYFMIVKKSVAEMEPIRIHKRPSTAALIRATVPLNDATKQNTLDKIGVSVKHRARSVKFTSLPIEYSTNKLEFVWDVTAHDGSSLFYSAKLVGWVNFRVKKVGTIEDYMYTTDSGVLLIVERRKILAAITPIGVE